MAQRGRSSRKGRGWGWLISSVVLVFLMVGGFGVGLVVGFVLEEPTLVAGHIVGRTTTIDWGLEGAPGQGTQMTALGAEPNSPAPVGAGPPDAGFQSLSGSTNFFIQVGAFGDPVLAAALANDLRATGYPVQVLDPHDDDRWRVRVGPLAERAQTEELASRLKRENRLPTWILQESGE